MGKRELHEKRNWLNQTIETYRESRTGVESHMRIARADCENALLAVRSSEESWRSAKLKRDELIASIDYINGTIADLESEMKEIENRLARIGIEEAADRKETP